jgi:hypothetical protein
MCSAGNRKSTRLGRHANPVPYLTLSMLFSLACLLGIVLGKNSQETNKKLQINSQPVVFIIGVPTGSRTPVTGVKGESKR